jgi:hypothetical protein
MKRAVIIIFVVLILLAIPATVFLAMNSQLNKSKAAPATTLAVTPSSVSKKVGDEFSLEVHIDTAENQVVAVQLNFVFDPTKLEAESITNGTLFPNILSSGVVGNGTATIAIGAANTTTPIKGTGTAAVIKFKALAATTSPISVKLGTDTFVGALGEGSTNVLTSTTPSTITIAADVTAGANNLTASPTATPSGTIAPTLAPTLAASGSADASPSAVTVTNLTNNQTITTEQPVLKGKAPPGSVVTIMIHSDAAITTTVTADANGNWTYTVPQPLDAGSHTITVAAENPATGQTQTSTLAFEVSTGATATGDAMPVTGSTESTLLLLGLGALLMISGAVIPLAIRRQE